MVSGAFVNGAGASSVTVCVSVVVSTTVCVSVTAGGVSVTVVVTVSMIVSGPTASLTVPIAHSAAKVLAPPTAHFLPRLHGAFAALTEATAESSVTLPPSDQLSAHARKAQAHAHTCGDNLARERRTQGRFPGNGRDSSVVRRCPLTVPWTAQRPPHHTQNTLKIAQRPSERFSGCIPHRDPPTRRSGRVPPHRRVGHHQRAAHLHAMPRLPLTTN